MRKPLLMTLCIFSTAMVAANALSEVITFSDKSSGKASDTHHHKSAAVYCIANLGAGFEQTNGYWRLKKIVRVYHIGDRQYIGSMIGNQFNHHFFESVTGQVCMPVFLLDISADRK